MLELIQPLFINWNPDPSVFGLPIRWYGLLFAMPFVIGYWIFTRFFKNEGIDTRYLDSLTIYSAIATIAGARLGHVFFYEEPSFWINEPWRIFAVWEGGLASHGAAIGIITGMWLYSRRVSKRSMLWLLDRIVVVVALSGLFIRTGNLVNSEIEGNPTDKPWGVIFQKIDQDPPRFYATQEGDNVKVHIGKEMASSPNQQFQVLHSTDTKNWTELPNPPVFSGKAQEFTTSHPHDLKQPMYYRLFANELLRRTEVKPTDSLDQRRATLMMDPSSGFSNFDGRWKPEGLELFLSFVPQEYATIPELMRSTDLKTWTVIKVFPVPNQLTTVSLVDPVVDNQQVYYRVSNAGERKSLIWAVPRHPSMMYEAFVYILIFFFLYRRYWSQKGKIREGELFGYFLVMVFTARLIIEFLKVPQEQFQNTLPLNVGQLLSIPFILLGIAMLIRARKVGVKEYPPFPAIKEKGK